MKRNEMTTTESETATRDLSTADCEDCAPTDEQIRSRAHEIYQARCTTGNGGDELDDWIAAESELKARVNGDQEPTAYGAESKATQTWRPGDPIWRREAPHDVGPSNGEPSRS
ncbi:MAG TPA: hypothetical protein VF128_10435 [Gemmatimonadaceae bacterium]